MDNENCCKQINKNIFNIVAFCLAVFLVAVTVFFAVGIYNKMIQSRYIAPRNVISVVGSGEIYVKPDLALIDFSVNTQKPTVEDALSGNSRQMNQVINFVKTQDVAEKDIKTTNFNISPVYEYQSVEGGLSYPYYIPNGKRVLVGYEVRQQIQVKIRNLDKAGQIIKGAADAGANQVGDLQFTIDDPEHFKAEARAQAIEKAKNKARDLSSQVGVKLGKIINFSEDFYVPMFDRAYENTAAPLGAGGETLQVQPGENKITTSVTITYEIR